MLTISGYRRVRVASVLIALLHPLVAPAVAAEDLVRVLADGAPWKATHATGPSVSVTLNPDGSGLMQMAGMSRKVRWAPNTGGFCLTGMPGGAKCLTLLRSDKGLVAKENDVIVMTFSR